MLEVIKIYIVDCSVYVFFSFCSCQALEEPMQVDVIAEEKDNVKKGFTVENATLVSREKKAVIQFSVSHINNFKISIVGRFGRWFWSVDFILCNYFLFC